MQVLNKIYTVFLFIFALFAALPASATANPQHADNTTVELFHDGKNTAIAKFTMADGWHIYWSNPGEIGLPTVISANTGTVNIINQSVPQIRTVYEDMEEYLHTGTAYYQFSAPQLNQAVLTLDFVECQEFCKSEQLVFDMAQIPATDAEQWEQIVAQATATFPQRIELSSTSVNELSVSATNAATLKFIPATRDIIDPSSLTISQDGDAARISWQTFEQLPLRQALLLAPDSAYLADIIYQPATNSLLTIIFFAFLGGILLNAMPCVFPVLSLKIFTLLRQERTAQPALNALSYTLGVLLSFLLLTTCLIVLKSHGETIGWGFQLQSPLFVGTMAAVFFVLFLYMMEWLRFPTLSGHFIYKAADVNNFTSGFFAVLIASPCTGPFMGAAIGYAFMRSNLEILAVFTALALGYALPYALVELYPQTISRLLPKPGKWMKNVKIILSIPVLLTSLWLASICYTQLTTSANTELNTTSSLNWQTYDSELIAELNAQGENIFIDFTADWCLTCKFNEKFLLNTERFADFVQQNNVRLFVADLTENNSLYNQALESYGRDSIPLYVYYHNGNYRLLPLFFSISDMQD